MYIVVLITAKNVREANKIAKELLERKVIACANIVRGVKSFFWWQNKMDKADETLMMLKAKKECFTKIVKTVTLLHSYDVPEVIALPIVDGNRDYLKCVDESCSA